MSIFFYSINQWSIKSVLKNRFSFSIFRIPISDVDTRIDILLYRYFNSDISIFRIDIARVRCRYVSIFFGQYRIELNIFFTCFSLFSSVAICALSGRLAPFFNLVRPEKSARSPAPFFRSFSTQVAPFFPKCAPFSSNWKIIKISIFFLGFFSFSYLQFFFPPKMSFFPSKWAISPQKLAFYSKNWLFAFQNWFFSLKNRLFPWKLICTDSKGLGPICIFRGNYVECCNFAKNWLISHRFSSKIE